MTNTREAKRVTFNPDTVEISEIPTNKVVDLGFDDHQARMYKFSHFLPYSRWNVLLNHANEARKLWYERFGHINYRPLGIEKIRHGGMAFFYQYIQWSMHWVCDWKEPRAQL